MLWAGFLTGRLTRSIPTVYGIAGSHVTIPETTILECGWAIVIMVMAFLDQDFKMDMGRSRPRIRSEVGSERTRKISSMAPSPSSRPPLLERGRLTVAGAANRFGGWLALA